MIKNLFLYNRTSITDTLIYLFPVAILGRNTWGASILTLLTIVGAFIAIKENINPFKHQQIKLLSVICTVYFSSLIIFTILSEKSFDPQDLAAGELFFLFAPFIALSIHRSNINFDKLILIIKLSLILLSLIVLYRSTKTVIISDRVLWVSHIGVMLLVFSWINVGRENKYNLFLTFISSTLALNAIMLAGTRGPLLSFIILSILFIYLNNQYSHNKNRNKLFAIAIVFITFFLVLTNPIMQHRMNNAHTNTSAWIKNSNTEETIGNTSTGQRMEMYKSGLLAAKERPIFGYGYKNTTLPASKYTLHENRKYIQQHTHLHNTYIEALVYGGIVAFLATIIFLLLLPIKKFIYAFRIRQNTKYAMLGILLISSYALLSLTDTMSIGLFEICFYVFFISVLLPKSME